MAEKPKTQTPEGTPEEITPEGPQGDPTPKKETIGEVLPSVETDYKKKFGESTRENQRILEESKQKEEKIAELEVKLTDSQRTLSEKELKAKYPNWEFLDEEEKKKAKEDFEKEKRLKVLEAKAKWRDDFQSLPEEIKEKIEKKGGETAFKDFACSPENRGQKSLGNLSKQFLYEEVLPEPSPETPNDPVGLESGTGGPKTPIIPEKGYTSEEAKALREKDSKKYNRLVAEGKMKIID